MSLSRLTDRSAVLAAIDEYDRLGQPQFLKKYGFRVSRGFVLEEKGRSYDSKAIVGAAFGYQFPDEGHLPASSFSGGKETVERLLKKLGFSVVRPSTSQRKSYWALCANPQYYNIDDAVHVLEEDWWTINASDVQAGDEVAIWRTAGGDGKRGVIALGVVTTAPEIRADTANPFWLDTKKSETTGRRVAVRYTVPQALPVWADTEKGAFLRDLSVYRARGGSVFQIEPQQWSELITYCGERGPRIDESYAISRTIRPQMRTGGGQGYGLTAEQRKAVEQYAMGVAIAHYQAHWPKIEDVSASSSCDLLCYNGDQRLFVEVKGTTTVGGTIFLTKNEVDLAEHYYPNTSLFIVRDIDLRQSVDVWIAEGGSHVEILPWKPDRDSLEAIAYQYWTNGLPPEKTLRHPHEK